MGSPSSRILRGSGGEVLIKSPLVDAPSPGEGPITVPPIEEALIAHLRQVFRPKIVSGLHPRLYDEMVGQQAVIDYLERTRKDQQEQ